MIVDLNKILDMVGQIRATFNQKEIVEIINLLISGLSPSSLSEIKWLLDTRVSIKKQDISDKK